MPDPTIVLAVVCLIGAAFGFGFMAGQRSVNRKWLAAIDRAKRIAKL